MTGQELKPKAKEEAPAKGERVRPGRVFIPAVDIYRNPASPGAGGRYARRLG